MEGENEHSSWQKSPLSSVDRAGGGTWGLQWKWESGLPSETQTERDIPERDAASGGQEGPRGSGQVSPLQPVPGKP